MAQITVTRKAIFLGMERVRRAQATDAKPAVTASPAPPSRAPLPASPERLLRNLALAIWIERGIDDGMFVNYADAARGLGVSRARVSQVSRTLAVEFGPLNALVALMDEPTATRK